MRTSILLFLSMMVTSLSLFAQKTKVFHVKSPDGKINLSVEIAAKISWSVTHESDIIIAPSTISLTLANGEVLGDHPDIISAKTISVNHVINTPIYKKKSVIDNYNQLTLQCKGDYGVIVRAYNDGVAYRFFTNKKGDILILSEEANFNFDNDYNCFVPHVRDFRGENDQFIQSFEALYTEAPISKLTTDTLGFLPALIETGSKKAVILEADLEDYPGMFIKPNSNRSNGFKGVFASYPLEEFQGGFHKLNTMVSKRADYIAKVNGTEIFHGVSLSSRIMTLLCLIMIWFKSYLLHQDLLIFPG